MAHSTNTVGDFKEGDTVVYIPRHKQVNHTHDDCEPGQVSSTNDTYVFVRFWTGEHLQETAQACSPLDLWHRP